MSPDVMTEDVHVYMITGINHRALHQ